MERRQVFDLPPMTVQVTEHQLIARRCSCGATTCGTAPEGVSAPVSYGPRITAIILYLDVGQFLSKKRTAGALAELFGTPVSEGTVATMTKRAADGLDDFLSVVTDRLAEAEVAGFDETGLRVAGTLHGVHCARTGKYTLITCHTTRGTAGIDAAGVLGRFRGVAVHDAWAPYDTYLDVEHQLCCAHALRELAGVADTTPSDTAWCWATQAADTLVAMQHLVADTIAVGADTIDADALDKQVALYRCAAQIGITLWGSRSRPVPLTWMIGGLGRRGMIVSCVVASALPNLAPGAEPAVVARAFLGVSGRRTPSVAPRGRRVAQGQPDTASGLGRPSGVRRARPGAAHDAAGASLGHAGHDPALASAPGSQEMDVSPPRRASTDRRRRGRADRTHGPRESSLGVAANPGRVAQAWSPRGGVHDPPRSAAVADTSGAGPGHRHDLAAVPARPGVDDVGV
jgi:Transposase IS66 family